jgi:hypothetical protein
MKKILILALSSDWPPYDKMLATSEETWNSIEVPNVETIFVCGSSDKENTDKIKYFNVGNGLFDIGKKNVEAFGWALANKDFDVMLRINASCYVDKKRLVEFVEKLPNENVFAGALVNDVQNWLWGGASFVISRDVVQKIYDNRVHWDHLIMEDRAMSYLVNKLKIPFSEGKSGSIDKTDTGWNCISYGGETISFTDFSELKRLNHHCYRVKCDGNRSQDEAVMRELFKILQ